MIRPTDEKVAEQEKLAADLQEWLAKGNKIKQLPGIGVKPTEYSYLTNHGTGFNATINPEKKD